MPTLDRWQQFDLWLRSLEVAGLPTPPRSLISEAVGSGRIPPEHEEQLRPWAAEINRLLRSTAPVPSAHAPQVNGEGAQTEPSEDQMVQQLREWRDDHAQLDNPARRDLGDAVLRSVVKFRGRPLTEMQSRIPPSVFTRVREMRRVLGVVGDAPDDGPDAADSSASAAADTSGGVTPEVAATNEGSATTSAQQRPNAEPSRADLPEPGASGPDEAPDATRPPDTPDPPTGTAGHGGPRRETRGELGWLDGWAAYDGDPPSPDLPAIRISWGDDGSLRMRWRPQDVEQPMVIYRVVAHDGYLPYDPNDDEFRVIAVTGDTECVDEEPMRGPLRYVTVWAHAGRDETDAADTPPVPIAVGIVVTRPADVRIREDNNQVVGSWIVRAVDAYGAHRVNRVSVQRIEAGSAQRATIADDTANLSGFVDRTVQPGRRYAYRIAVHARDTLGRHHVSSYVQAHVQTDAPLVPVSDLQVRTDGRHREVDVEWTAPPAGEVRIYRHDSELRGGITRSDHPLDSLAQMGLNDDLWCFQETQRAAHSGHTVMRGVGWPNGWQRIYFTPVTVLGDRAIIGRGASTAGVAAVSSPRLVERVGEVVVTFGWPPGAAGVRVHLAQPGSEAQAVVGGRPDHIIDASTYRKIGGLRIHLPPEGQRVFLTAEVHDRGKTITGPSTHVDYPGLDRVRYAVSQQRRMVFAGRVASVTVKVWRESSTGRAAQAPSPWFVLVHNPGRLPLYAGDGEVLRLTPRDDPTAAPMPRFRPDSLLPGGGAQEFRAEMAQRHGGFVRLFVHDGSGRQRPTAVLDPPVSDLRLDRSQT